VKNTKLTKGLTITGTILAGLPVIAPLLFAIISLIADGKFRFDYLMPAELFFLSLAGAALLIWAAIRARSRLKLILWSLGVGIVLLFGGQGLAMVTGLANGRIGMDSNWFIVVMGMIILFSLAMVLLFISGILLYKDLRKIKPD
jgi:lysylphosphatidylglycerol synthetase-like protein (DUF2156 family)